MSETFNIDAENPSFGTQIILSGALYTSTLGQGQTYHQGLFGPFPFGKQNLRSLVYSKLINDPSQKRNKGTIFVLVCFVFKKNIVPLFYDRIKIEIIFKNWLKKNTHINDLNQTSIENIYNLINSELTSILTKNLIKI